MIHRLACVSWADPDRRVQVDLYDSPWNADELAAVMDASGWDSSSTDGLRELLGARLGIALDGYTERSTRPDGDTVFVLWRKGTRRPDRYLHSVTG